MKKQYVQYVYAGPDNCGGWVDKFVSDKPITMNQAVKYYEKTHSFDWDSDSITFIDEPEKIKI